jgi:hypothetical protein
MLHARVHTIHINLLLFYCDILRYKHGLIHSFSVPNESRGLSFKVLVARMPTW